MKSVVHHAFLDPKKRRFGIVGGLGALGGADVLLKMIRSAQRMSSLSGTDIAFEQRHFGEEAIVADGSYDPTRRKFYIYNALKDMEARGIDTALVPCFLSHTFLGEITPEVGLQVVSVFDALCRHFTSEVVGVRKIGVLTSTYLKRAGMFERELGRFGQVIYPDDDTQASTVMQAVYGARGLRAGHHGGECQHLLLDACLHLVDAGADIIVPGMTEIPVLIDSLRPQVPVPILDANLLYAEYALGIDAAAPRRGFKLGVVGGVGPAATVDFMHKVVKLTAATRDQDHIKMVVEQNPQIPDRTANLIGSGDDPTIALLATCMRLKADGADAVAIPCNTAHAYVDRIQPYLDIPIVNMLSEVVRYIRETLPAVTRVGLLATSGTVASGVYKSATEAAGLELLVPDGAVQASVMEAIYGRRGVKAGFTRGACAAHLVDAIVHLQSCGAEVIVLGCTELPLIELTNIDAQRLPLIDPTAILARCCVALAGASCDARPDTVEAEAL
ncbi:aspartate/glutamate racemase family protein [Denitromonas sp. IR12]|uniref:Aspartate/glutamate racemase family protein n=2 Tax=Denitromonas iodatirespirans TaxID=2795389 RepID=A0A944H7Z1_DENI1|nr:aspartate/glutamate racemase family protein [Denitromonas iodatirespirans]